MPCADETIAKHALTNGTDFSGLPWSCQRKTKTEQQTCKIRYIKFIEIARDAMINRKSETTPSKCPTLRSSSEPWHCQVSAIRTRPQKRGGLGNHTEPRNQHTQTFDNNFTISRKLSRQGLRYLSQDFQLPVASATDVSHNSQASSAPSALLWRVQTNQILVKSLEMNTG